MNKEMTKHQRDYAIGRVKGLRDDAIDRIKEQHPAIPTTPDLENNDMVHLVRSGEAKIFPKSITHKIYGTLYLYEVFDFGPIKAASKKAYETKRARIQKALNKETSPIYVEAMKIIDKIMLGDAAEALKLIEGFAKMCS